MRPLSIEEILELPIGSKVFVDRKAIATIYRDDSFYCKVLSITTDRIELSLEVIEGLQSFHHIDLGEKLEETMIHHSHFDITEQVFLDDSGVDRVYSDRSIKNRSFSFSDWYAEARHAGITNKDYEYENIKLRSFHEMELMYPEFANYQSVFNDLPKEVKQSDMSEIVSAVQSWFSKPETPPDKPSEPPAEQHWGTSQTAESLHVPRHQESDG